MKFSFRSAATVAVCAAALIGLGLGVAPRSVQAQTSAPNSPRSITVTGIGSVSVNPDVAHISLGVNIANKDLNTALKQADTQMTAVLAALKKLGIADSDVQTEQYSVYLETPDQAPGTNSAQIVTIYHVIHIVHVNVNATDKVGDVLTGAVAAGANAVNNVDFGVKDPKAKESEARKAAMADARARAAELAANAGATLGQVLSIEESSFGGPVPKASAAYGGLGGGGPISGSQTVSISLTVTFQIQ